MKKIKYLSVMMMLCCLVFAGCDKYLDVTPKGKRLLSTVTDYDQWLNDESLTYGVGSYTGFINFLGDNYDYVAVPTPPVAAADFLYLWAPQFVFDLNTAPIFWGDHYARINSYNTVLVGIDAATGGGEAQKKSLKAEALLGRSLEYFYLLNEYAKVYDPATAKQDLAVPFVTSNDVSQKTPPRATVAEIYQHIIDDVNAAIPNLPVDNSANRYRGSVAAGYSLLARLYFYALNYPQAQKYAELALANTKAVMLDYNGPDPASNSLAVRADVIYARVIVGNAIPTLDYMRSFTANDLRIKKFYFSGDGGTYTVRGVNQFFPAAITPAFTYVNTGTSVSEMKLIAAEAAAHANNLTTALNYLDDVRKARFATASYVKFASSVQEDVIQEILLERNHELGFSSLRWFDMRRLDKENRMPTVYRYDAKGTVVASIQPHGDRYTLQIPFQVMSFNPGMQQNP